MISKRNFAIMTSMMLVLLVMFMATRGVQGSKEEYSRNNYYEENPKELCDWKKTEGFNQDILAYSSESRTVIFVGDTDSEGYQTVSDWCNYTKGELECVSSFNDISGINSSEVNMVIAGPEAVISTEISGINNILSKGISVLIYELPEPEILAKNIAYRELFGIQEIVSKDTEINGIKMFSGFMLGGEVIYKPGNAKEEKMQDLNFNVPWYQVDYGTKVFMVGLKDNLNDNNTEEAEIKNEQLPPIIWRTYHKDAFIYSVNGDYFNSEAGLGIMSAVLNDSKSCYLYPVVNAQNISVIDFPGMADENSETLEEIYSRPQNTLCRDVLLPSIISFGRIYEFKMTAYMMAQADYQDDIYPRTDMLDFYYQQFYQNNIEMGLSTILHNDISLEDKLLADTEFYDKYFDKYKVGSLYLKHVEDFKPTEILEKDIYTLVTDMDDSGKILTVSGNSTVQRITSDALEYKYSSDFNMRCLETALGYSNIKFDMGKIFWPSKNDVHWEVMSEQIFSVAGTYWKPFYGYSQTTISESDRRVRDYLNLNYACVYGDNEIKLELANTNEGWFLLRTHNQEIDEIEGADYTVFEEDAYLLHVYMKEVNIRLKDKNREGLLK